MNWMIGSDAGVTQYLPQAHSNKTYSTSISYWHYGTVGNPGTNVVFAHLYGCITFSEKTESSFKCQASLITNVGGWTIITIGY